MNLVSGNLTYGKYSKAFLGPL